MLTIDAGASATCASETPPRAQIMLLTASHFVNDSYGAYVPILLPLLMAPLNLSLGMAGMVVTAYTVTSSIIQPYLGHIADKHGTRAFSYLGTTIMAVGASLVGLAPNFVALLVLVTLAGAGTAAFHPQSAAMASSVAKRSRGTFMSLYLLGGNLGYASGPLILMAVLSTGGLGALPFAALPGLVMAVLLYVYAPRAWSMAPADGENGSLWGTIRENWSVLTRLLAVVIFRSWAYTGLVTFLPFYFQERGISTTTTASLVAAMLYAGAAGGVAGGYLSDHFFARRTIIVASLVLATPFLAGFILVSGLWLWVWAVAGGAFLLGSFAILTVEAQELMPRNIGMASGLMVGFSIGIGGLSVSPMGWAAERAGVVSMVALAVALPAVSGLLALTLPAERTSRARPSQVPAARG